MLREHTLLTVHADYFLEYSVKLSAPQSHDVTFDDTKEGFFGIRFATKLLSCLCICGLFPHALPFQVDPNEDA